MRNIVFKPKTRNLLHIEAPGCIVNIRAPLSDMHGNNVTSVEVLADPGWQLPDFQSVGTNIRVTQGEPTSETPQTDDLLLDMIYLLQNVQREIANYGHFDDELDARRDEIRAMQRRLGRAYNEQRS